MAELRGKVHFEGGLDLENSEDLLTSNVFQLLRYVQPENALLPVLGQAVNLHGEALRPREDTDRWELLFWPRYEHCEPDLEIRGYNSTDHLVARYFVEAKYLSPKSGDAELNDDDSYVSKSDQLEREWSVLQSISEGMASGLIYLTAHYRMPRRQMETSVKVAHVPAIAKKGLYWVSWQRIATCLEAARRELIGTRKSERVVLQDIVQLLDKKGLTEFSGWDRISTFEYGQRQQPFFFNRWSKQFFHRLFSRAVTKIEWRFENR